MSWLIGITATSLVALTVICVACFAAGRADRRRQAHDAKFRTRVSQNPKFLQ